MKLLLPSFLIAVYLLFSLVLPLRAKLKSKAMLAVLLLAISLKYIFYQTVGGSFFRPALPVPVLLTAEALYASLVILFFLAAVKDCLALVLWLCRRMGANWHMPFSAAVRGSGLVLLALSAGIWGTFQSVRVPEVRTVEVRLPNLPAELEGFSIAQLTDVHIGPLLKKEWLSEVVKKINDINADIAVITGDIIDGLPHELKDELLPLSQLRARHGVFGVNGNHEYYYDARGWLPVFRALGVDILNNEHRVLPGGLVLGGVTDRNAPRFGQSAPDVDDAFSGAPDGTRVLLSHQPQYRDSMPAEGIALQLSGHTHGGLLFFLKPLIAHYNKGFVHGLYETDGGGQLYVAPGTGLWSGFSCRLGVPSEITRIVLKREK
ncbi:MAG: metallophosphoesterase [Mailhella sp.]|nr:metallophosphoesterase [Mailhella sp.]